MDEKRKSLGNFEKIFDKNSIQKLILAIFGNFVDKNGAVGNILFLQQFFPIWGGGTFGVFPPGYATNVMLFFLEKKENQWLDLNGNGVIL